MPRANVPSNVGNIEIEYETFGSPSDPTLLLVMGFTAQMIAWSDDFCRALAGLGLYVVRFDNRDCGLSSKLDGMVVDAGSVMAAVLADEPSPPVPYTLSDMASDAIGLLDQLAVDSAHVVGASMGGMIVQHMAIEHPTRVRSLTSIMSTTGEPEYGSPTPEAAQVLLSPPETERQAFIDASTRYRVWQSKRYFDEVKVKSEAARSYDRSFYPEGSTRQLAAIYASGRRHEALMKLTVPTLVIHGTDDTLIPSSGGRRTHESVPNSTLLMIADMGHDLPDPIQPMVVSAIHSHVRLAEWRRATGR